MTESLEFKMEPIKKFAERIDAYNVKQFNYLRYFRDMNLLYPESHRVEELSAGTLRRYN